MFARKHVGPVAWKRSKENLASCGFLCLLPCPTIFDQTCVCVCECSKDFLFGIWACLTLVSSLWPLCLCGRSVISLVFGRAACPLSCLLPLRLYAFVVPYLSEGLAACSRFSGRTKSGT